MASGCTVLMSKVHLFDSVNRKEVFSGNAKLIESPYVTELLSYQNKGSLIYFDKDEYPIDIPEYKAQLIKLAKEHSSKVVTEVHNVSYTEYLEEDGTTVIYMINIDWWKREPAWCKLNIEGKEHKFVFDDNDIHIFRISAGIEEFNVI